MNNQNLINQLQNAIFDIYKEQKLKNLSGLDASYIIDGIQIVNWHDKTTRKGRLKYLGNFDFNSNFQDILFCSDEIMHFLAQMYFFKPFINNPLEDTVSFHGEIVYINNENNESHKYSMYTHVLSEKIYNYWDRIGDLIAVYFPDVFTNPKRIFFADVIDKIPSKFHNIDSYKWLKDFRDRKYKKINDERIKNVHYITADGRFKDAHSKNVTDGAKMATLYQERLDMTENFKEHMDLTIRGFAQTMLFIEEVSNATITDAEIDQILLQLNLNQKQ